MAWTDQQRAARLAADIPDGWVVNLGTGLSTGIAAHLRARPVLVQSENGILGVGAPAAPGEEDPDIVDAGKNDVTIVAGAAFMDSATSFGLLRGGHLDLSVMGAYQVSQAGDLANWRRPGSRVAGIGGAADLAVGARRVWVLMSYTDKKGRPKLVTECGFPLTAKAVVRRLYTDLAILDVGQDGFLVRELAPGVTVGQLQEMAAAPVRERVSSEVSGGTRC